MILSFWDERLFQGLVSGNVFLQSFIYIYIKILEAFPLVNIIFISGRIMGVSIVSLPEPWAKLNPQKGLKLRQIFKGVHTILVSLKGALPEN